MDTTTPSGLAGNIRGLSGKDGRYLADLRVSKANKIPDYILKSCWLDTTDSGIYRIPDGQNPDWGNCLVGDRDYTLLRVRVASYGPEYSFKVVCQKPTCRHRFEWEIDLDKLPVKELKKKDREIFLAGNRFEETIPDDGRKVTFKLATGNDVLRAAMHRKEMKAKQKKSAIGETGNLLVESILMRIVELEGIAEKSPRRRAEKHRDFLEELPMRSVAALLDRFDSHDCGIETTIEVECEECEEPQDVQLPFDGDFFFPRASSRVVGSTMRKKAPEMPTGMEEESEEEDEESEEEET
jgi:hypothetical protein